MILRRMVSSPLFRSYNHGLEITVYRTADGGLSLGRREKTPTPKTRFSIWTLLRNPSRFTTRPLPVYFTTKMSVVRPFSVLSKDEIGPESKTGRFLSFWLKSWGF